MSQNNYLNPRVVRKGHIGIYYLFAHVLFKGSLNTFYLFIWYWIYCERPLSVREHPLLLLHELCF